VYERVDDGERDVVTLVALWVLAVPRTPTAELSTEPVQQREVNPWAGHILDGSGYLLPKGAGQIGFVESQYAIFDFLSVGTSPYPWLLGPVLNGFVGNLNVKGGFHVGSVAMSLEARYMFLNIEQTEEARSEITEERVEASVAPITAAVTWAPGRRHAYSLAARYVLVDATADESRQEQEIFEGSAATDQFQLILSGRWRLTKTIGLYGRGYLQPWTQDLSVTAEAAPDARTRYVLAATLDTNEDTSVLWSVLGGVHLVFANVNVRAGLGYGHYFAPAVGLSLEGEMFYPDFDIYVRL
jgi:hypothetical protein